MSVYTRAIVYVCVHRHRLNIGSCLQAPQGSISVAEARPLLVCVTLLFFSPLPAQNLSVSTDGYHGTLCVI